MMSWIAAGFILLLAVFLFVPFGPGGRVKALASRGHLREFADLMARVRAAALAGAQDDRDPAPPQSDARSGLTSGGVRVYYTILRDVEGEVHHLSVSIAGGLGAPAAILAQPFALLALRLLRGSAEADDMDVSERGICHAEWALFPSAQKAYAASPAADLSDAELERLYADLRHAAAGAFSRRIHTGVPGEDSLRPGGSGS